MDPVDGGSANAYVYVLDPINGSDLSGRCMLQCTVSVTDLQPTITQATLVSYSRNTPIRVASPAHTTARTSTVKSPQVQAAKGVRYLTNAKASYDQARPYVPEPQGRFDFVNAISSAQDYAAFGWLVGATLGCAFGGIVTIESGGWGCLVGGEALSGPLAAEVGAIGFVVGGLGLPAGDSLSTGQPDGPDPQKEIFSH